MIKRLIEDLEKIEKWETYAHGIGKISFYDMQLTNELNNIKDFLTRLEQVDLEETTKFVKNFIPLDEPNCSACMYYTESDCTQEVKGKCRLYELQNLLNILKGEE